MVNYQHGHKHVKTKFECEKRVDPLIAALALWRPLIRSAPPGVVEGYCADQRGTSSA